MAADCAKTTNRNYPICTPLLSLPPRGVWIEIPTTPTYRGDLLPVLLNGHWKMVHPGVTAAGHQLKGTSPKTLEGTFVARFSSGHIGIFERTGGSSASGGDAIREIMGSSLPQMVGNEAVLESLSESVRDKFDERLTHEVDAILNGWR